MQSLGYNTPMILRRRRLWFVVFVGLVLAGGVWWWALGTAFSVNDGDRIDYGMTRGQVAAIIGRKPDKAYMTDYPFNNPHRHLIVEEWWLIDGYFSVTYEEDEKAVSHYGYTRGFFECLRRRVYIALGY